MVRDFDSGAVHSISSSHRRFNHPTISPDGRHVVYWAADRREQRGGGALFIAELDGSGERPLTRPTGAVVDADPAWSPDGSRLAFTRRVDGGHSDILMLPWAPAAPVPSPPGQGSTRSRPGPRTGRACWSSRTAGGPATSVIAGTCTG